MAKCNGRGGLDCQQKKTCKDPSDTTEGHLHKGERKSYIF